MRDNGSVIIQIERLIDDQNDSIAHKAQIEFGLGVATSLALFVLLFFLLWACGFLVGSFYGLPGWVFALVLTILFEAASTYAAWKREDPLKDLEPLTDQQILLTQLSLGSDQLIYFSPRHAAAGAASFMISGPANIMSARRTARSKLPKEETLLKAMAQLLTQCKQGCPLRDIADPTAALTLRKLNLVKVRKLGEVDGLVLTERGQQALGGP